jgi:hypothetical protein
MKSRCSDPNSHAYKDYGGRGIKVCKRWLEFENFLADMGERPEGLVLERRNNNRSYCPSNCRWATIKDQNRNKRTSKLTRTKARQIFFAKGSYAEIGQRFGVSKWTARDIKKRRTWADV